MDLSGGGTFLVLVLVLLAEIAFFAKGEDCRGSMGSETTLLIGEAAANLGDG